MPVTMSYPKARDVLTKAVSIARTDSATEKCVLPKDAVIVGVDVAQTAAAAGGAATVALGWSGSTTALLSAFSMATTSVGYVTGGAATGSAVGTKLDSDKTVLATYTAGSSTSGGTGYAFIKYFVPGPGETVDS